MRTHGMWQNAKCSPSNTVRCHLLLTCSPLHRGRLSWSPREKSLDCVKNRLCLLPHLGFYLRISQGYVTSNCNFYNTHLAFCRTPNSLKQMGRASKASAEQGVPHKASSLCGSLRLLNRWASSGHRAECQLEFCHLLASILSQQFVF